MPSYPGGVAEMKAFIRKNLKYPKGKGDVEGNVLISFFVHEDGSLSDFTVVKGLSEALDNSALEMVKKMPRWIPAKENNKPFRTKVVLPVSFGL